MPLSRGYFRAVFLMIALMTNIVSCASNTPDEKEVLESRIHGAITRAWNDGDIEALDDIYDANFIRHRPPFDDYTGLRLHKERVRLIRSAYPDHKTIIHDVIIDGDMVALWYTWKGTHTGEGLSLAPTGKRVSVPGCDVYKIVDGMIVEEWDHEGFLSLYQQLGYTVTPPEPQ